MPYLLVEESRQLLFPNAPLTSVTDPKTAQTCLDLIRESLQGLEAVGGIDLGCEQMQDLTGERSTVGDDPHNVTFDVLSNPAEHSLSDESFKGFEKETPAHPPHASVFPKLKSRGSNSNSKKDKESPDSQPQQKSESGKKKSKSKSQSKRRTPPPHEIPLPDSPPPAMPGPSTGPQMSSQDMSAITTAVIQAMMPTTSALQEQFAALASEFLTQKTKLADLSKGKSDHPDLPQGPAMPPANSLPDFDPQNPWRSALYAPSTDELLTIEGIGTRPISDFERYPPTAALPFCYVRLSPEAAIREDKVPKETIIFPREKAQSCFLQVLRATECVNIKVTPFKGNLTMFTTNEQTPIPFASKILDAVNQALIDEKTNMSLREEESTSFLFPGDSQAWKEVALTFSEGKLEQDCASAQFNENLPKLSNHLVNVEFEARMRLARTLSSLTSVELGALTRPEDDLYKVVAKGMLPSFRQDLMDFGIARRNCRKHILQYARVRHEPVRLINSSLWGPNLFPRAIVSEVIQTATQSNASLRTRWDMPLKRKSQDSVGPQPKNKRTNVQYQIPKIQQPQQAVVVPVSPSGQPIQGLQGQQFVVLNTQPSPAYNKRYEKQTFRNPGFQGNRGGRGGQWRGGNQRRGQGRGQSRGGGRGLVQARGYGRQRRGRGAGRGKGDSQDTQ